MTASSTGRRARATRWQRTNSTVRRLETPRLRCGLVGGTIEVKVACHGTQFVLLTGFSRCGGVTGCVLCIVVGAQQCDSGCGDTQAAAQNLPEAQYNVGVMHLQGMGGLEHNPERAYEMFQQAADGGCASHATAVVLLWCERPW